ncbi:MAG: NAD(P)/FAD-dependent oxidoreductase [Bacillota bacterium]|jgi:thioredoxin reductase (NADPH)
MTNNIYDVLIIGGGPAGLSAAIYAARAKMNLLLLEKDVPGGQAAKAKKLSNYPGTSSESSGSDLMEQWVTQAMDFGVKIKRDDVIDLQLEGDVKTVTTLKGRTYQAYAIIICGGILPVKMDIPGKKELMGRGVSYCITCDAPFFENKEVYIYGIGQQIIEETEKLCDFAKHVNIVLPHEKEHIDQADQFIDLQKKYPEKIKLYWDYHLLEIKGTEIVKSVVLQERKTSEISEYPADGIFFFTGMEPQSNLLRGKTKMTLDGYIITDEKMQTSIPGVFAAGDIRDKYLRQVVTAASDGVIAATAASDYIDETIKKAEA